MTKIGQKFVRVVAGAACLAAAAGMASGDQPSSVVAPKGQPGSTLEALLSTGERNAMARGEDPAAARRRLFDQLQNSTLCFVEFPTQEQLDAIAALYDGLPPGLVKTQALSNRFFTEQQIWFGVAPLGQPAQLATIPQSGQRPASQIRLSYSFPADGVQWGSDNTQLNDLNARLTAMFPTETGNDHGRELIRQALAQWRRTCGVNYYELTDNNEPLNFGPATSPTPTSRGNGDIRFGSYEQGTGSGVLAFNYLPAFGGDMTINSTFFTQPPNGNYTNATSNGYRLFRNAVAHEHGHGLGFLHSLPCNQTKLMEPFNSTTYDGPQIDELRGAQQNYGDRFTPNQTSATAHSFGLLASADALFTRSLREQNLSTNGAVQGPDGSANPTGEDWFHFRLDSRQFMRITVRPTGGVYTNGPQVSMCASDMLMSEQALTAGDLVLEVFDAANPAFPIGTLTMTGGPGHIEEVQFNNSSGGLNTGDYLIHVKDIGPNPNPLKPVQLYDLEIRIGDPETASTQTPYSPVAVAGINKRATVNVPCQFIGDLYSKALEPGVALRTSSFEWDLDGDGVFEVRCDPNDPACPLLAPPTQLRQPRKTYTENGVIPVTLRVTDDNMQRDQDTILVVVTGNPVSVTSIDPNMGTRGMAVPVRIIGANLGAIFLRDQVTITGSGITIVGTPIAINNGTEVVGLTFVIGPNAPLGYRDVTVTDGTTNFTLVNAFEVVGVPVPPANDDCVGAIAWPVMSGPIPPSGATQNNPFNNTDAMQSTAQEFPGTPCSPAGMFADVWYTWIAPDTGNLTVRTNSLPDFSSRVAVYDSNVCSLIGGGTLLGCGIDGASFTVPVVEGQTYIFRVGSTQTLSGGTGTVTLTFEPTIGACCDRFTGVCTRVTPSSCTSTSTVFQGLGSQCGACPAPLGACCITANGFCNATLVNATDCAAIGGTYQGPGSTCGSVTCPQPPTGACCTALDGSCQVLTMANCAGNTYMGDNTVCTPNPCPQPQGACCAADGMCASTTQANCSAGWQGANTMCSPNPCPQPPTGACCAPDTTCSTTTQAACGGTYQGDGSTCSPTPCVPPAGACCATTGICSLVSNTGACPGGTFQGPGTACSPNPCTQPATGACCTGDACTTTTQAACTSGTYRGDNTSCTPNPCVPPVGACCAISGTCSTVTQAACTGAFQGTGTTCLPNPCPQPTTGSCCRGTSCIVAPQSACVGGLFGGVGSVCAAPTCCQADFNGTGVVSTQDLFDYLDAWFAVLPSAEFDTFPGVTTGDLFAYLDAFFLGCPTATTGSCCTGTACTVVEQTACTGRFDGSGTTCASPSCCQADINGSGAVTTQDIFDYLDLWFALDPRADIDGFPGVTAGDIFAYLDLFFIGC